MGVWLRAKRRLDVVPEPDEKLMSTGCGVSELQV